MALIFKDKSICGICGKPLSGKEVVRLPAIGDVSHELYVYFDQGFHARCFDKWDKKQEVMETITLEKLRFHDSGYFQALFNKYSKQSK